MSDDHAAVESESYRPSATSNGDASTPTAAGGWGSAEPIRPSDWRLVRQAINEGWDVSQRVRDQVVARASEQIESNRRRMMIATLRAVVEMESANVAAGSDLWPTNVNYDQLPTD